MKLGRAESGREWQKIAMDGYVSLREGETSNDVDPPARDHGVEGEYDQTSYI